MGGEGGKGRVEGRQEKKKREGQEKSGECGVSQGVCVHHYRRWLAASNPASRCMYMGGCSRVPRYPEVFSLEQTHGMKSAAGLAHAAAYATLLQRCRGAEGQKGRRVNVNNWLQSAEHQVGASQQ